MLLEIWLGEPSKTATRLPPVRKGSGLSGARKKTKAKPLGPSFSYREYIRSYVWRIRRHVYFRNHRRRCAACGIKQTVVLHHLSYENLGHEPDDDLMPLCRECHSEFHRQHGVKARRMRQETLGFVAQKRRRKDARLLDPSTAYE